MNIRFNKLQMLLPAVALIASCTKVSDSIETQPNESQISITTRADASYEGKTLKLSNGSDTADYTYSNQLWSSSAPLYWKADGSELSLSAYIVNPGASTNSVTLGSEGAIVSSYDYQYYFDTTTKGDTPLSINLKHVMSKVVVSVEIEDSVYQISKLNVPSPTSMSYAEELWTASQTTLGVTAEYATDYTAYVIPSSYDAGAYEVSVDVGASTPITATYDSSVDIEAGKVYTFSLKLSATGDPATLSSTISVTDWEDGDDWGTLSTEKLWSGEASETSGEFGGGTGSESDPFLISSAEHLAELAEIVNDGAKTYETEADAAYCYVNKYFRLTTDIDLNNLPWTPIGYTTNSSISCSFSGKLDGDGHKISNMNITKESDSGYCIGLIGCSRTYGTAKTWIKDLTISNATISSYGNAVGALVGYINNGIEINDCNVEETTITYSSGTNTTNGYIGGLVGQYYMANNAIYGCDIKGLEINATNGSNSIGGLVGGTTDGIIIVGCSVDANLNVTGGSTGGLVGTIVYKTYDSTANANAGRYEGGIGVNTAHIYGCYTTGAIEKADGSNAGGLVNSTAGQIIGCYSSMTNNASSNRGGLVNQYNTSAEYPVSDLFKESYFINTNVNCGYPIRIVSHDGETLATGDGSDGDTYSAYFGSGSEIYKLGSTTALEDKIEAMNEAISADGYNWEYEASSENAAFPYVLVSKE